MRTCTICSQVHVAKVRSHARLSLHLPTSTGRKCANFQGYRVESTRTYHVYLLRRSWRKVASCNHLNIWHFKIWLLLFVVAVFLFIFIVCTHLLLSNIPHDWPLVIAKKPFGNPNFRPEALQLGASSGEIQKMGIDRMKTDMHFSRASLVDCWVFCQRRH